MFNFLTQNKKGELVDICDLISMDMAKLELSKMAFAKAVNMIAHAIAKSEFVIQRKEGVVKDEVYWKLNVQPNPRQTGTDFWIEVIQKLLYEEEACVCRLNGDYYLMDSFNVRKEQYLLPEYYENISLLINGESFNINRSLYGKEVLHFRANNKKIRKYLQSTLNTLNELTKAIVTAKKIESTPKFILAVDTILSVLKRKKEDGTEEQITLDQYKDSIKKLLESESVEVFVNQQGLELKSMKLESNVSSEDIAKLKNEIFTDCAFAFDIPKAVFLGEITEKADSTNEFITYAVGWIVEILSDSLNAKLVGERDYLNGEYIWIDLSRFKHVDVIESANNLDKLRAIGFNLDEIREMVGWSPLNTEFSKQRVITKNYTNDLGSTEP